MFRMEMIPFLVNAWDRQVFFSRLIYVSHSMYFDYVPQTMQGTRKFSLFCASLLMVVVRVRVRVYVCVCVIHLVKA